MESEEIYLTIVAAGACTAACRLIPVLIFSQHDFGDKTKHFLQLAPIAILCAMMAPEIFLVQNKLRLDFENKFFWVAIPSIIIAAKTKNISYTVLSSMALLALWRAFE